MNNFTKKTLIVQVELKYSTNPYFVLVPPGQSADFDWPPGNTMAGFCLGKIKYLEADSFLLNQNGLINKATMEVRDNRKLLDWLDLYSDSFKAKSIGLSKPYIRKTADLRFMPDELYNETVAQAKRLSGTEGGAAIVGWFADLIAQSECRSRDISIVEKNGKIGFYTLAN